MRTPHQAKEVREENFGEKFKWFWGLAAVVAFIFASIFSIAAAPHTWMVSFAIITGACGVVTAEPGITKLRRRLNAERRKRIAERIAKEAKEAEAREARNRRHYI